MIILILFLNYVIYLYIEQLASNSEYVNYYKYIYIYIYIYTNIINIVGNLKHKINIICLRGCRHGMRLQEICSSTYRIISSTIFVIMSTKCHHYIVYIRHIYNNILFCGVLISIIYA